MVERFMCDDDRRSVFATITAAGRKRYVQARPTQRAVLRAEAQSV
jgi:DNA-binding MarR family transcriptional regulator